MSAPLSTNEQKRIKHAALLAAKPDARVLDSILIAQATAQKPATPDGIDMPEPVEAPDLSAVSQAVNEAILARFRRRNGQSDA